MADGSIPQKFAIDFSHAADYDMVKRAWSRMLSQFWGGPVFKDFIKALIQAGPEESYKRVVEFQKQNTLYEAGGANLDAIGNIVGQGRVPPWPYDESKWFFADRQTQGEDSAMVWVEGASMAGDELMGDSEYRRYILARIIANMTRFASAAELQYLVKFAFNIDVGYKRVSPMGCELYIMGNISVPIYNILTRTRDDYRCDDIFAVPYPATLKIEKVIFMKRKPFIADRADGHQEDAGYCALDKMTA